MNRNINITIQFESDKKEKYTIQMLDEPGRTLIRKDIVATKGLNQYHLDITGLAQGTYFVQLLGISSMDQQKIIVY